MTRFLVRRVLTIPFVVLLANFFGYVYAFYVGPIHLTRNPYASSRIELPPIIPIYVEYLKGITRLEFGVMYNGQTIAEAILKTGIASLGLIAISLTLSVIVGLFLGLRAVKVDPPKVSLWLTVLSTVGLASPSFYIGILFITFSIFLLFWTPGIDPVIPFQGFGWDAHLILPVLALMVRPTVQIAQMTSGMLSSELEKQYITAARSFGHSLKAIRGRYALRNITAPVILTIAGSLRLLVAELIIVERLFSWPGFGRLISSTLVLTSHTDNFLEPQLVAALLTILVAFFLLVDFAASFMVRVIDPRLRAA
ncbi:MAG: ABC transporter permease [Chloroflexota bacterium]|nr:MAG: ABC transporter permease [Chloroflexota bacterium]